MPDHTRRRFIEAAGTAVAGVPILGGRAAASTGESKRFLIDLREVSRSAVPAEVDIVHDVPEIDVLAARGDPDAVPGAVSTVPDVAIAQHDSTVGPAQERDAEPGTPGFDSGEPTLNELQWDKRVQGLADLTEHPGRKGEKYVHDTTRGDDTRVAVIDTGVYDAHPDLADVIDEERSANFTTDPYDWRPNGAGDHGTHVAGIVAATNSVDDGVLGTAPETDVVSLRVFSGNEGAGGDVIASLTYAATVGCDAANLSLGIPAETIAELPESVVEQYAELYGRAVDFARQNGTVIVNSTGNAGLDLDPEDVLTLPTELDGVFGVSATGPVGYLWGDRREQEHQALAPGKLEEPTTQPARYTNYGETATDISAAGGNYDPEALAEDAVAWYNDLVLSTVYTETDNGVEAGYGWKAGTSMAAPQVTGAVALVRSLRPDATTAEVESLVRDTASEPEEGVTYHGAGHLDLRALVDAASGGAGN